MLIGAVVYAKELNRLVPFYVGLGFSPEEGDGSFQTLVKDQTELTVVQAPENIAAEIEMANPAMARVNTPLKLVFVVESIEASAARINELGGRVDRGQARWEMGNYYVQDAVDPEGNILQMRELKTR